MPPKPTKQMQMSPKSGSSCSYAVQTTGNGGEDEVLTGQSQILNDIQVRKDDFLSRCEGLLSAMQGIRAELKAISARFSEAEERINSNQDDIASLCTQNTALKAAVEVLLLKLDDLENCSHRSNLRLVGLPERAEGLDMIYILEKWIPEALGAENIPRPLLIAHRIGRANGTETKSAKRPRVGITKFLNYADKFRVMKAARLKESLLFDNQIIGFSHNISAELLKRRCVFDSVKKELALLSISDLQHGLVHPVTLLITYKRKRYTFDNVSAAEKFVQELKNYDLEAVVK